MRDRPAARCGKIATTVDRSHPRFAVAHWVRSYKGWLRLVRSRAPLWERTLCATSLQRAAAKSRQPLTEAAHALRSRTRCAPTKKQSCPAKLFCRSAPSARQTTARSDEIATTVDRSGPRSAVAHWARSYKGWLRLVRSRAPLWERTLCATSLQRAAAKIRQPSTEADRSTAVAHKVRSHKKAVVSRKALL